MRYRHRCGAVMDIPPGYMGRQVECAECGEVFVAPRRMGTGAPGRPGMGRPAPGRRPSPGMGAGRGVPGRQARPGMGAGRGVPRGGRRGGGESAADRQAVANAAKKHMVIGALISVAGIVLTAIGYANAASKPEGGTYIIWWGLIVVGVIEFFRGFSVWQKHK